MAAALRVLHSWKIVCGIGSVDLVPDSANDGVIWRGGVTGAGHQDVSLNVHLGPAFFARVTIKPPAGIV